MAYEIVASKMKLKPGVTLKLSGDISPDAKHFRIALGNDGRGNIAMHFNARFNYLGDYNVIVLNTMEKENWGEEIREENFPFMDGTNVEIILQFQEHSFFVKLPNNQEISIPNRTEVTTIDYLRTSADITIKSLAFE
ncbi:galectin-1-like [Antechinus flavipes]|uniref:galectin-1-like n=1 Tax=Antechinus flavipes TaxID=38775 RepID=UPI0022354F7F|nr:galectin-1-like [Antechinus flavipes]